MLGASCFALGAIPAYVHAVGANADAMTFFVGSLFFTSASYSASGTSAKPRDDRRRRTAPADPHPGPAVGLAAARQELAGCSHAVTRDALLQHQHVCGDRAQPQRGRSRQARLAP